MENKIQNFLYNTNNTTSTTLGTPQAMNFYSIWQERPVGGVVICQVDNVSDTYVTELFPGMNPRSGCQYPLVDPFKNTTAFRKDTSYEDYTELLRYNSVSSVISDFSQTFSGINLHGNEWAVACTAFTLEENGHTFCIIIHPNEIELTNFCKTRGWNYRIVDSHHL